MRLKHVAYIIILKSIENLIFFRCDEKKWNHKLLPKKAAKVLRGTLERLIEKLCQEPSAPGTPEGTVDVGSFDQDFLRRTKQVTIIYLL